MEEGGLTLLRAGTGVEKALVVKEAAGAAIKVRGNLFSVRLEVK